MAEKKCSKCQETKDYTCFGFNKLGKDGRGYYCKDCIRKIALKYYYSKIKPNRINVKAFELADYKCKLCGSTSKLNAHHLIPKSGGGDDRQDTLKDLMVLCRSCHLNVAHEGCFGNITNFGTCKRCNYEWFYKKNKKPKVCPKCKSWYWELPKDVALH